MATYTSVQTGDWTDNATWGSAEGTYPGSADTADEAVIGDGSTADQIITLNANPAHPIAQIRNGDKIKFIYLKVPNPIRENVVAFPSYGVLPESMGLHKYVDYDKMWESVFIAPLKGICTAIGWTPEKKASLEDFFG
jgi:hypothetical protein